MRPASGVGLWILRRSCSASGRTHGCSMSSGRRRNSVAACSGASSQPRLSITAPPCKVDCPSWGIRSAIQPSWRRRSACRRCLCGARASTGCQLVSARATAARSWPRRPSNPSAHRRRSALSAAGRSSGRSTCKVSITRSGETSPRRGTALRSAVCAPATIRCGSGCPAACRCSSSWSPSSLWKRAARSSSGSWPCRTSGAGRGVSGKSGSPTPPSRSSDTGGMRWTT